jgi:eukaryotic-like serine/threonine-protein kinase
MNDSSADLSADTIASRGPVSGESQLPSDSRLTTVLPKVEWTGSVPRLVSNARDRFEELGVLGAGGMGEVVLARDHDIGRKVALKRMHEGTDISKVLRFVDEVRAVGSLEHPNIVPVHDVGMDAAGRFFFVMKKIDGETLQSVIEKLRSGDQPTVDKYSFHVRAQIFLGVLAAVAYAHKQGFVHRDLKPANIMLGPFGEVTVMDWGLAKRIREPERPVPVSAGSLEAVSGPRRPTVLSTQMGSIMGTPLYMSPEQARGEHDKVDERSDIYSLTVLFHEFIGLRHYLAGKTTLPEVLEGVQTVTPTHTWSSDGKVGALVPPEMQWYLGRGFEKKPEDRFKSVDEMISGLQQVIDGRFAVQCPRTLTKRVVLAVAQGIDSNPKVVMPLIYTTTTVFVVSVGLMLINLISAL